MRNTDETWPLVESKREDFFALSDRIWGMPELSYNEHRSCAEHAAMLEEQGFRVTRDVAGIADGGDRARPGEDGPVIAILGEYDALPGLSQEAGVAEQRRCSSRAGTGMAAGIICWVGVAARGDRGEGLPGGNGIEGARALLRLPGGGRRRRQGVHGAGRAVQGCGCRDLLASRRRSRRVNRPISLANTRIDFTFHGRASHAAAAPHLGRSALDAVELMNVGVNYMREHMPVDARIHYALLDAGGIAPNVVQASAKVRYLIRARDLPELHKLIERVKKIAEGAALMTETDVRRRSSAAFQSDRQRTAGTVDADNRASRAAAIRRDGQGVRAEIQATLTEEDIATAFARFGMKPVREATLCDFDRRRSRRRWARWWARPMSAT